MIFQRIRDLREDSDLTQEQVAEMLGVKQTTYSKYELGKILVPIDILIRLADFYQVSLDYLVGRSNRKGPSFGRPLPAGGQGKRTLFRQEHVFGGGRTPCRTRS